MQIGVNGRGWVQMGAIGDKGPGGQVNKASMHIYWDTAHAFRPYGREISQKFIFMWYRHKVVRVGAWGQLDMRMGALGL